IMGVLLTLKANMERLPKEVRDDLMESAYNRTRDLERLIDMLLRGARAELAGAKEMVRLPVSLHQSVAGFNASRPIRMNLVPDANVLIDPAALRQILGVLLENAISHSPAGSPIDVNASCEDNTLVIDVSNEGTLPTEITSEELFRPFQRGADARSSGVGLGLYVAAKLAESMEGFITAHSTEGKVTFSFSYPLGNAVSHSTV
ncbi:MAG TPA: ATP-binding protein, partial [Actinomycetota bacterium]|nr:ATP-binding protein [Actinomycetota bacterium]